MTQLNEPGSGTTFRNDSKGENAEQHLHDLSPNAGFIDQNGPTLEPAGQITNMDDQTLASTELPYETTEHSSLSRNSKSFSNFPLFIMLPVELRLEIYDKMCDSPRIIEVSRNRDEDYYHTDSKVPAVLQICVESRTHGLKGYHKIVQGTFRAISRLRDIHVRPFGAYINYSLDTVYMSLRSTAKADYCAKAEESLLSLGGDALSLIQHLAFDPIGTQMPVLSFSLHIKSLQSYTLALSDIYLAGASFAHTTMHHFTVLSDLQKDIIMTTTCVDGTVARRRLYPEMTASLGINFPFG